MNVFLPARRPGAAQDASRGVSPHWLRVFPLLLIAAGMIGPLRRRRGLPTHVASELNDRFAQRARQQRAIAELGNEALRHPAFSELLDAAVRVIAQTLEVEFVKVLERTPSGELVLRAGAGYEPGLIGRATVPGGVGSQAGYALASGTPVIVEDLRTERRFHPEALLAEHGVISGLTVAIGRSDSPFGALAAHAAVRREFSEDDVFFLQAVANLLGSALERTSMERDAQIRAELYESILETTRDGFALLESSGVIVDVNDHYCTMTGYARDELRGATIATVDPSQTPEGIRAAIDAIATSGFIRFETRHRTKDGRGIDVEVSVSRCAEQHRFVSFIRDISERKRAETDLADMRELLDRSQELARVGGWNYDVATSQLTWTDEVYRIYGVDRCTWGANELRRAIAAYDEPSVPVIDAAFQRAVEDGVPYDLELGLIRSGGERIAVRTIGQPVVEHGRVVRISGTIADVTELRRAEVQLRESQELLRSVVDHAPTVIFLVDLDGRFLLVNDRLGELYGVPREQVEGRRRDEFVPASYDEQYRAHDLQVATDNLAVVFEETADDERGERTFLSVKFPVRDAGGRVYAIGGISTDITERKLAERTRAHLAAIVESSDDAIIRISPEGRIESWNRGAARIYGYSQAEAFGLPIAALAAPDGASDREPMLEQLLAGSRIEQFETRDRRRDGRVIDVSLTDSPIRDTDGNVVGIARIARDITERKRLEGELTYLATHDPLTGLLNRRQLTHEVHSQCARASRYGETAALLIGDIDNFKYVNDSLGHNAGDEVIKRVAAAIQNRLRATDVLARLGGDEFGVLLPVTGIDAARMAAESLCDAVAALEILIEGNRIRTTISFGVFGIEGPNIAPEDALTIGDFTMYEAKRQGRNRVAVAQPGTEREQAAGVAPPKRLHAALREHRFELHAQPIVHLATGTVDRYELLLRMRENDELLYPDAFIHTAERYGLIGDIDRWVVEHAFELIARAHGARGPHYMVNLSGTSIGDRDLLALIERGIGERGIDPGRVTFEITETAAIADIESARAFLEGLHQAGCSAALDDFGSGFGSFYYLKYLPIDYLKIDGDFVRQLPDSQSDQLLIKAIVDVARGLNKYTIAEHVGSEEAVTMLRELGVDYGQGFHLGRPQLPAVRGLPER